MAEQKNEPAVTVTVLQSCSTQVNGRTKQLTAGETVELPEETATALAEAGLVEIAKGDPPKQK